MIPRRPRADQDISAGGRRFPVDVARHPRARRYVLRVTPSGRLRLTVPRGASIAGGLRFAETQHDWIVREWQRLETRTAGWQAGTLLWFRGRRVALEVGSDHAVLGDEVVSLGGASRSIRAAVERHLWEMARRHLPVRLTTLSAERSLPPANVSVRNQRSRWGSCSTRGTIALNWRLIQMPAEVSDYVILHELAHRRQPNHSSKFWREVEALCPWWRDAERWLRRHGKELL